MCLAKVTREPKKTSGFGWVVRRDMHSMYVGTCRKYKLGKWYRSSNGQIRCVSAKLYYRAGFHIFRRMKDAAEWDCSDQQIVKVQYRKAHACGTQSGKEVVVAKEIKHIKIVREGTE